ncbi:MAG: recombination mediator RecR [Patescibacteria group bacterium]
MKFPASIQNLINFFEKLPSVGPKTAERYVFYLLKMDPEALQKFAQTIAELKEKTTVCKKCLAITESDPCYICADQKRNQSQLCIVSNTQDMLTIESTKQYNGLYYILGGLINTITGIEPKNLNIRSLEERIKNSKLSEIILALNPTVEGETTALFLTKILKPYNIKISRLAKGLPMGSDLEYADDVTLANALKYRIDL